MYLSLVFVISICHQYLLSVFVISPTWATSASCISEERAWSPLSNSATRSEVLMRSLGGVDDDDPTVVDDAATAFNVVVVVDAFAVVVVAVVAVAVAVALNPTAKRFKASMSSW